MLSLAKSKVRILPTILHSVSKRFLVMSSTNNVSKHYDRSGNIVWVDLEMSGLDVNTEHILEMACIITDGNLNIVAEGPDLVIQQPDSVLDNMGEWCKNQHGKSGLTEAVRRSNVSLKAAETQMSDFVRSHIKVGQAPLAGNSVHADRMFLQKYMPNFLSLLHYRIVDVSTIKELAKRWYPDVSGGVKKNLGHRALEDIRESIEELKYYREKVFK